MSDENSVLNGAARPSLQSTAAVNRSYMSTLEKGASYPGPGDHRQARDSAGGRTGGVAEGTSAAEITQLAET
jgi:hypothetical protein